jgi:ComF family protein
MEPGDAFLGMDRATIVGDALLVGVAAFVHRDAAQRILRRLKYGGGQRLAAPLARLAAPALRQLLAVCGPAVLVPVPLHEGRHRERGYNQAALLAEALGRETRVRVWPGLIRRRVTERQHGLDRTTRLRNLRDAMAVGRAPPPEGRIPETVVVVDDILTTGATFEACAVILRAAGVTAVYGFAIAREV